VDEITVPGMSRSGHDDAEEVRVREGGSGINSRGGIVDRSGQSLRRPEGARRGGNQVLLEILLKKELWGAHISSVDADHKTKSTDSMLCDRIRWSRQLRPFPRPNC
jgi:hypothetical protein